jgi:hypothetical protein
LGIYGSLQGLTAQSMPIGSFVKAGSPVRLEKFDTVFTHELLKMDNRSFYLTNADLFQKRIAVGVREKISHRSSGLLQHGGDCRIYDHLSPK